MSFESPSQAAPAAVHTGEEVEQAIRALTPGDFKKLRAAAYALVRGLGLESAGRDHEDLYSEALARTLDDSRGWRRGVDFRHHLTQAMRSIAWTWHGYADRREKAGFVAAPAEAGHPEDEGEAGAGDPMDPPSGTPDIETAYLTTRELAMFHRQFRNDRAASVVMLGWERGCTMKEMAQGYGISTQDLQWAARRIRRFAQKNRQEAGAQGGQHDRGDSHGR